MSQESAEELKSDRGSGITDFNSATPVHDFATKNNRDTPAGQAKALTAECQPVLGTL